MVVDFNSIANESRLWIYQIDRDLNEDEESKLLNETIDFLNEWTAHGSKLSAAVKIIDHRLLIIAADESNAGASGCSIDSQVAFLRNIQLALNIDLFSRNSIFYKENNSFKSIELNEFKNKISSGEISDDTLFYNTTIHKKDQLENGFIIPVKESWLMRVIVV